MIGELVVVLYSVPDANRIGWKTRRRVGKVEDICWYDAGMRCKVNGSWWLEEYCFKPTSEEIHEYMLAANRI